MHVRNGCTPLGGCSCVQACVHSTQHLCHAYSCCKFGNIPLISLPMRLDEFHAGLPDLQGIDLTNQGQAGGAPKHFWAFVTHPQS